MSGPWLGDAASAIVEHPRPTVAGHFTVRLAKNCETGFGQTR
jgi:hypothetical protein